MANLLDTIKQNSAVPQQGVTDESQKLQVLLRAKSGKAIGGAGLASSNLGEQGAVSQTNQQIQTTVAPQAEIQNTSLAQQSSDIAQQEQAQKDDINQSRKFDTIQTKLKTNQILNEMEQQKGKVDVLKDNARLEQLGVSLRLQTQAYTDNLAREGASARLDNELAFKEAALHAAMGNDMQKLSRSADNSVIIKDNDREFQRKLAQMDIYTAMNNFANTAQTEKQRELWTGLGNVTTAGVGAAGKYQESQAKKDYYTNEGKNETGFEAYQARK